MRQIHIINPAAGRCKAEDFLPAFPVEVYRSAAVGDIERFVFETCTTTDSEVHFIAYGGDGTLNEVINGVMLAGAQNRALVSCIPTGTGNDFVRNFADVKEPVKVDVLRYNDRYAINMLNTGFDCNVVARTAKLKKIPLIAGSFAYILGVVCTLCRPIGHRFSLDILTEDGTEVHIDQELLLIAAGNGCYCGGGFYAMPHAKQDDGYLDLLVIEKITRRQFLKLVGDYKAGTYLDIETGKIKPEFKDIIHCYRTKRVLIHNMEQLCADGEVAPTTDAAITIVPRAITFVPAPDFQDIQAETNDESTSPEPVAP